MTTFQGELEGVWKMIVSTMRKSPLSSNNYQQVIIFFCGPQSDRELMLSYGDNLLRKMNYSSCKALVYFKTDVQTARGVRSTGARLNHVHKLKVKALHGDTLLSDDNNWYTIKMESAMKKAGGDPDGVFIMFFNEHLLKSVVGPMKCMSLTYSM